MYAEVLETRKIKFIYKIKITKLGYGMKFPNYSYVIQVCWEIGMNIELQEKIIK
jgi:hypothetical protein